MNERTIRKTGKLVGVNTHHKSGHFYEMPDGQIYRAMTTNDNVYPICNASQLDKLVESGGVSRPTGKEHFCQQCGIEMGHEWLLGAVCGRCCRLNHRRCAS